MLCSKETYIIIFIIVIILLFLIFNKRNLENFTQGVKAKVYNYNTEWCFYSREFQPIWNSVMESYKSNASVKLEDIKCDKEENMEKCKNANIRGFPTVILQKSTGETMEYKGPRTVESITSFINNAVNK